MCHVSIIFLSKDMHCNYMLAQFVHSLDNKHLYLQKISLPICRSHLIQPCVKMFMAKQGFDSEKGSAIMLLMPNSIVPLEDLLKDRSKLLT